MACTSRVARWTMCPSRSRVSEGTISASVTRAAVRGRVVARRASRPIRTGSSAWTVAPGPRPARARLARVTASTSDASSASGDDDLGCAFADSESAAAAKTFRFEGTRRLYGDARFEALASAHVVVLGMGGVGSWAVEALARSGVGALTLVDLDFVCVTNVNRQVLAADSTVGAPKADVMAARVADINPECDVRVINDFVDARNVEAILGLTDDSDPDSDASASARRSPRKPDFVLDAIDAERDKAAVVACCVHHRVPVLVTGGAGGVDTLGETVVEDLATATFNRLLQRVRRILRRDYAFPKGGEPQFPGRDASKKKKQKKKGDKGGKFGVKAVYAPENANHFATAGTKGRGGIGCDGVGGSAVFVTGALGFRAASHIVIQLMEAAAEKEKKTEGEAAPSGRATTGWRSRVWPRGNGDDEGGGDGGGGGGGGGDGGGGGGGGGGDGGDGDAGGSRREDGESSCSAAVAVAASASSAAVGVGVASDLTPVESASDASGEAASGSGEEPAAADASLSLAVASLPASAIFDAHCHWHLDGDSTDRSVALASSLAGAAFTSTEPPDWDAAALAAAEASAASGSPRDSGFGLALGLHPWWAHHHPIDAPDAVWLDRLRAELASRPLAIVGEIGLDRVAVPMDARGVKIGEPDYANQTRCFEAQLALAAELGRPVAVHCVRAYGDMGDIFRARETFPPRVLMHSYGGTVAFLEGLTRMRRWGPRFYFGFSSVVNLRSPKTQDVVRAVPADRLLVESDLVSPENAEAELREMVAFVARARGWTAEEAARITRENARRFYGAE